VHPLDDVRIVAVEQYGAGPWASLHLADLGAEVIKVEDPSTGGDVARYIPPFASGQDSLFFQSFNRNKKSIALDLTNASGRGVFEDLVANSDAVFSNLRGDVPKRLGLVYDDLKHLNPAIVCCSLSAYGMTGPRSADPGYDYILQGLTGWMSLTGEPDSPPTKTGLSLVDYSGGYVAAISLLAGIHSARRTGIGMDCDVSLFDTAISLLTYVGTWTLSDDEYRPIRASRSAHPSIFPFQAFETADGWIMIACPKEKFWQRLVEGMELDSLATDDRYSGFAKRFEFKEELSQILGDRFVQRGTGEWVDILHPLGVPCGPVNDVRSALEDPHVADRNLVIEYDQPGLGTVRMPRTAVNVGDVGPELRPGPALAENSSEILTDLLGYSDDRAETLKREGAFGTSA
jgi:crotonobetainyl-CoA:carnitine CoA-transferase CaiB-like acyl-CoA transferase